MATAKRYLAYFTSGQRDWACADQVVLRTLIPAEQGRAFKPIVETIADADSVLELSRDFGLAAVTVLARPAIRATYVDTW